MNSLASSGDGSDTDRAGFSEKEQVAIRLAELVTQTPNAISDDFFAEVLRHFDEGEVIELLAVIGLFNYFNRFNDALRMEPTI